MLNHHLKVTLGLLLAVSFNCTTAEEKAKMLNENPGYCKIFYHLNGDVPEDCPKKRGMYPKS